eukprot:TRINITY_DN2771_c0_g2_i1.p1 TRINITY_DN2771_c0_g2~~TRINITY_DN2771_c0_g2_i1.p1  ORF type:complete len:417 (+),score=26.41 TRINITY_DN2771_c0_g2_i1:86-1252(+)
MGFKRAYLEKFNTFWCFIGITSSILLYGVIQERVMTVRFGEEYFKFSLFLVLCNRVATCIAAFAVLKIRGQRLMPSAPLYKYAMVSFANVIATTSQYETLKFLNFPMQTLSKCAKMIPVMVWGTVMSHKIYSSTQYFDAGLILLGSGMFVLSGNVESKVPNEGMDYWTRFSYGGLLMMLYLVFDGFTSTWQDRLFSTYNMDLCNQMLYSTLFSSAISWIGLLMQNQIWEVMSFVGRHPGVWYWIFGTAATAISVQFFINYTIKKYGAFVFATIMTTRQFLSIFLSVFLFGHRVSTFQWLGTFVVFGALYHHINGRQSKTQQPKLQNSKQHLKSSMQTLNVESIDSKQSNNDGIQGFLTNPNQYHYYEFEDDNSSNSGKNINNSSGKTS